MCVCVCVCVCVFSVYTAIVLGNDFVKIQIWMRKLKQQKKRRNPGGRGEPSLFKTDRQYPNFFIRVCTVYIDMCLYISSKCSIVSL